MTGNLDMNLYGIANLQPPFSNGDATNKFYVDTAVATALTQTQADARYYLNTATLNDIAAPTTDLDMDFHGIVNLADPTSSHDAVTKQYADNTFYTNTTPISSMTAPTDNIDLNAHKIINL